MFIPSCCPELGYRIRTYISTRIWILVLCLVSRAGHRTDQNNKLTEQPKALRTDNYIKQGVSKGDADLFWPDRLLNSKVIMTWGETVKYGNQAGKVLSKGTANDESLHLAV